MHFFRNLICPILLTCAISTNAYAQESGNESTLSIKDLVSYTDSVAHASRLSNCESITVALNRIDPAVRKNAAKVLASIEKYDVTDEQISTVRANSNEVAAKASACSELLQEYKSFARLASAYNHPAPEPQI